MQTTFPFYECQVNVYHETRLCSKAISVSYFHSPHINFSLVFIAPFIVFMFSSTYDFVLQTPLSQEFFKHK